MTISKFKIIFIVIFLSISIFSVSNHAQIDLDPVAANTNAGDKPQSKVWYYGDTWWAIIPLNDGTYLHHLVGTTWVRDDKLPSSGNNTHADCKVVDVDGTTYVLLVHTSHADLYKLTYSGGTYTSSSSTQIATDVDETATIDIDGSGKMWCAWDASGGAMKVSWSSDPYTSWSTPITLFTTGDNDDICALTAFDGKIGVLWSNQPAEEFQFKYHTDGTNENTWHYETAATGNGVCGNKLCGIADDHMNFAVNSNGTLYAAVKTSLNDNGGSGIQIGLLKRSTSASWSFYDVSNSGTRPIALLDQGYNTITVVYTSTTGGGYIVYKSSPTTGINFHPSSNPNVIYDTGSSWNNSTSTKQSIDITGNNALVLFSDGGTWRGSKIPYGVFPVELAFFSGDINGNRIELNWKTVTEVNNYGFNIERAYNNDEWLTIGFVEGHGNSNSPKEYSFYDSNINQPGKYSYRLKQIDNDGTFEYSDVVTVNVTIPEMYYLSQNYPNPFNPTTTINYIIPSDEKVSLKVYDLLGREVVSLVDEYKPAGTYSVTFNADKLASGVYIYRLVAGGYISVKRMTLIK